MCYVSGKQLKIQLRCDGELSFYDMRTDSLVLSNNPANISLNYTLDPGTQVVALRCRNHLSKPWIMGSVSNGLVTDTRWKCLSLPNEEMMTSLIWASPDFDDNHWAQAVTNVSNREESPWGKVPGISENNSKLFCRRSLSEVSIKPAKSNGMSY